MAKDTKKPELMNMTEAEFITHAKKRWAEGDTFLNLTIEKGKTALKAIRGDDEAQWDKDVLQKRKDEGRPYLKENLLPAFVRQVEGDFRMNTPAIKVVVGDLEADPESAEVLQGKIYRIRYQSQAQSIHQDAFEQAVRTGYGIWGMHTRWKNEENMDQEIYIRGFENHFAVRYDPSCKLPDTSDKKWVQIYDSYTEDEAKVRWPEASWDKGATADTPTGAAESLWWSDKQRGVCEYWYMVEKQKTLYEIGREKDDARLIIDHLPEGVKPIRQRTAYDRKIYVCVYNGNEIIEGPTEWISNRWIPIFITFGEKFVIDGRKSFKPLVDDAIPIQQMHNYAITALVESIAMQPDAPWTATAEEIAGHEDEWNGTKKVKVLTFNKDASRPQGPGRENPPQLSQALWQMPQYFKGGLRDVMNIHEAALGMKSNETSGVAIQQRQQESDTGSFVYTSNFQRAMEFEGRCLCEAIQKLDAQAGKHIVMGVDGEQKIVESKKAFDTGTYEHMVTLGPSVTTQRQEARQTMTELLQVAGPVAPAGVAAVFPKVVKAMDMPDAHEIAEIFAFSLKQSMPEVYEQFYKEKKEGDEKGPINIPPEMMQQVQQMQMQLQEAQAALQEMGSENERLKREEAIKLAKIEADKEVSMAEKALRRDEIEEQYNFKRQELEKTTLVKIEAITREIKAKQEMHELDRELETVARLSQPKEEKKPDEGKEEEGGTE